MIRVSSAGDFRKTRSFLENAKKKSLLSDLDRYGRLGVEALAAATPRDSGETAQSWTYTVNNSKGSTTISWDNTHTPYGAKVAILIQYGHGTGTGGYVVENDYINPALRPIFDQIAQDVWRKVTSG